MKEQLIKFETAKLAKEKGFSIISLDAYLRRGQYSSFEPEIYSFYRWYNECNYTKENYPLIKGKDAQLELEINAPTNSTRISGLLGSYGLSDKYEEVECYLAPTQSLLQKWLREVHNIDVVIVPERYANGVNYLVQAQKWDLKSDPEENPNFTIKGSYWFNDNHEYPTYEDAIEKGLQEALTIIKNEDTVN